MSEEEPVRVTLERPESYGWLRTPQHDHPAGGVVYERPDGSLYVFPPGQPAMLPKLHPPTEEK